MKTIDYEPGVDEIANYLDLPINEVAIALEAISDTLSFSDPVYNDGDDTIYLMDQVSNSVDSEENWVEKLNLKDAVKNLSNREKQIVLMRYYVGKTQMEVSNEIGISQAQVSRLEKNAIKQLKKSF